MGSVKAFTALLVAVLLAVAVGEEKVQHVVGRLEPGSDLGSWLSGRVFRVGDIISPHDTVVELQSPEEFESCDLSNPIKMYTDGVDQIPLEREGSRYFVIGNHENCNNGQKLHVDVKPSESPPNPWLFPPLPYTPPEHPPPQPWPIQPPPQPKPDTPPPQPWPIQPPPHPKPGTPPPPQPWPVHPPPPPKPEPVPATPPPQPRPVHPPPPQPWPVHPPPPPKPEPVPATPPPQPRPVHPPPPPKPETPPPQPRPVHPPPPQPKPEPEPVPDTPPAPSGSTRLTGLYFGLFVGLVLYFLGL